MKLHIVVPRYSDRGGAENALRMTGEAMARLRGWDVEILTTCATSTNSWADELDAGAEEINGIRVRRHRVDAGRIAAWGPLNERVKLSPQSVRHDEEVHFFEWQGPVSHDLLRSIASSDADLLWFAPYLFWTTIMGVAEARGRSILHPAAHDEPYIRMPAIAQLMRAVNGFVYASETERRFLESVHPIGHTPSIVLGWGIQTADGDPDRARRTAQLGDAPYVLCVGRIEHAKGTVALARFWEQYKQRNPSPLKLVLAGDRNADIAGRDDLVVLESVDEETKWGLIEGAMALINPSAMEAFSLVLFESWHHAVPVLVNGRCAATREHVARSHGGLWYEDFPTFEIALSRLVTDAALRRGLGDAGHRYGAESYSWDRIAERFERFCDRAIRHRPAGER